MGEAYRTDWTGVPHTNKHAVPVGFDDVRNMEVVFVEEVLICDAVVRSACFEIADATTVGAPYHGKPSVAVRCLCYECKPRSTWMHRTLLGGWEVIPNFSGKVVTNIGPPSGARQSK